MAVWSVKSFFLFLICILLIPACGGSAASGLRTAAVYRNYALEDRGESATVQLRIYKSSKPSGCTAFVISRKGNTYLFGTAAHCVIVNPENKYKKWKLAKNFQIMAASSPRAEKKSYPAKLLKYELDKDKDIDFAVLEVVIPFSLPVLYLSLDEEITAKQCVVNFSFPHHKEADILYGLVDYYFLFPESFIVFLGGLTSFENSQGASGSAIIDCAKGKVLGILRGGFEARPGRLYILPASSFAAFLRRHNIELEQ